MGEINKSRFISSPLRTEPSLLNTINSLGEDSESFVSKSYLRSYVLENLPAKEAATLLERRLNFQTLVNKIRDFFESVDILSKTESQIWLPTWEIHRPKIEKCTATLKKSSTSQEDYSLNVKVFGVGGGITKSRSIGYEDTIEADGECLQINLPVKILIEKCMTKKGEKFTRMSTEDIGAIPSAIELKEKVDRCGLSPDQIKASGWETYEFSVPAKTIQTHSLSIQSSQSSELSLTLTMTGVEIGPKAVIKLEKKLECSYQLVGKHRYIAYFPKNAIAYYWSVS
jgi:hypothetical protein